MQCSRIFIPEVHRAQIDYNNSASLVQYQSLNEQCQPRTIAAAAFAVVASCPFARGTLRQILESYQIDRVRFLT